MVLEALKRKALVGHRGFPAKFLENTLESLEGALKAGADIVEVDLQRTKDGFLVLSHDRNLKRTFGVDLDIEESNWEDLHRIRKGSYRLARLEEALELVNGRAGMFLEVKNPQTASEVIRLVEDRGAQEWTALISFHPEALEPARGRLITGLIYFKPPGRIPEAKKLGCRLVLPKYPLATEKAVNFAHRLGLYVVAWTVNEPPKALELFQRGVDSVATDNIELLKKELSLLWP
ncbi:glycerophosphodiester phosphodiesterase [Thermosulfurimonas marina]|uniref:Glycerophosphodiester phosphodiesterase n=1 Tax=Thermosulfurimonas marina TaxID=2047767 RepID=A0A6H1WT64_9BACT|nr:glycerophosphodiester phosphodiesterase [Thermosulfurimonas marina]QJA06415.1 glycerophosphodiester phosphodiesterase [Thermosulfurimonas marina]